VKIMNARFQKVLVPIVITAALVGVVWQQWHVSARRAEPPPLPIGAPGGASTSRADLEATIAALDARLAREGANGAVAARLADALMRQARVASNPGLAVRAEDALRKALDAEPDHYEATRMLGTVLLSQHRFRDAIETAERASRIDPRDAWNFGVLGDAHLELGAYDSAFDAFDRMMRLRPSAAVYARTAYAREIQGDLEGALRLMQMAADATGPNDPESQAWHYAQVGDLYFQLGRVDDAAREYGRADFTFPQHPFAAAGLARVAAARGALPEALDRYRALMARTPTPELAARIGEIESRLGHAAAAERSFSLAENGWRYDTPEPTLLARLLAGRGRAEDALAAAERAAAVRRDIFTMDALAWASFAAGRLDEARRASEQALRTGTRDRTILYHAAAIASKAGDRARARELAGRALAGHPDFDPLLGPEARTLLASLKG
jgi:tetratricopeptide (TPR) repeat protein